MIDVFEVADIFVSHAVKTYGNEIDIIGYYGSYARGVASKRSDLDIYFIPVDGKNPPVNRTVLIDGLLFDFWSVPWDTVEGFATGRIRGWAYAPAMVYHTRTLYSRSDESTERLAKIKQQIIDLQQPASRPQMVQRAQDQFKNVCTALGKLHITLASDHISDIRHAGWEFIVSVIECLTLLNQTFLNRAVFEENERLKIRPTDLQQLITIISTASDPAGIVDAAETLAVGLRQILRQCQTAHSTQRSTKDQFHGAYPEINAQIEKMLSACEKQHPVKASCAAWCIQADISRMLAEISNCAGIHPDINFLSEYTPLYSEIDLPDLMDGDFSNLQAIAEQASQFDSRLRHWLREQSVELNEYDTVEEFAESLTSA